MPLPVITDVFRVTWNWSLGGVPPLAVNVTHFESPLTDALDVAQAVHDAMDNAMFGTVSSEASLDSLDVTPLDGSSSTAHLDFVDRAGTASGAPILNDCQIVKLNTAFRGKSHRGRMFLPFVPETIYTRGVIDAVNVAAAQTAWDNFLAAAVTATVSPVVASYKLSSADLVTSYTLEGIAGTQRRRQSQIR